MFYLSNFRKNTDSTLLSQIFTRVGKNSGVSESADKAKNKLGTRIIRVSQISIARDRDKRPSSVMKYCELAAHSEETQEKYYDVSQHPRMLADARVLMDNARDAAVLEKQPRRPEDWA